MSQFSDSGKWLTWKTKNISHLPPNFYNTKWCPQEMFKEERKNRDATDAAWNKAESQRCKHCHLLGRLFGFVFFTVTDHLFCARWYEDNECYFCLKKFIVWTRRWWSNQTILIQNWVLAPPQPNTPSKCWTNSQFRNQLTPAPWTVGSATGNHKIRGEILFRRLCNSYSSHHWTPEEGWSCNGESAAKATCWLRLCHRP